jgi:hypothetical protein
MEIKIKNENLELDDLSNSELLAFLEQSSSNYLSNLFFSIINFSISNF